MGDCSPDNCIAHDYIMSAIERFDKLSEKLSDGLQKTQVTLVKLSEQIEATKRLHDRLDKMESKVDEMQSFMWKSVGCVAGVSALVSIAAPFIMRIIFGV